MNDTRDRIAALADRLDRASKKFDNLFSQFETKEERNVSEYWQAHIDANCDKFNCKYCLEEINAFHEGVITDKGG